MEKLYFCGDFGNGINNEEKRLIPHIKRFLECMLGDTDFYEAIQEDAAGCGPLLESRGIFGVDPVQVAALVPEVPMLKEVTITELQDKPQALLWRRWVTATSQFRDAWYQRTNDTPSSHFNGWHRRQINRCSSQLGKMTSSSIIHGTIVFELSQGCSFQCAFCGLAAEPLKNVFMYTEENSRLWKDVLNVAVARLGTTAGTGACYWATDPTDNPDYFKFLTDFGQVTGGVYPQTTTAGPLRNSAWTQEMLQFRQEHPTAADRFSILSKNVLNRVHETFSAEDLAMTELILQYSETLKQVMATSGRNRNVDTLSLHMPADHTIACVTGYLVNMVEGSVRLISPCPPSDQTPFGYRVYAEGSFSCAGELDDFISQTMEKSMPDQVASDQILAFRQDLKFTALPGGFQLQNKYRSHKMEGAAHLAQLGRLIAGGDLTSSHVIDQLMAEYSDVLAIMSSIQKLFDQGLLEELLTSVC